MLQPVVFYLWMKNGIFFQVGRLRVGIRLFDVDNRFSGQFFMGQDQFISDQ
jgi:hypothetical protein